jgi:hypothetical protein
MSSIKPASTQQAGLDGFGVGRVVRLDGGKRIRLDDKVDFWPATGAWQALEPLLEQGDRTTGVGMASMLAFLKAERQRAGLPTGTPAPLRSERPVLCNHCRHPAELHLGSTVYPDRKDLEERRFWVCWTCDAWVGCHTGTTRPFGPLAQLDLRNARMAAHRAFDPVWQSGRMERSAAYDWLAVELGIRRDRCHIGMMELEHCLRVSHLVWERFGSIGEAEAGDIDF